MPVPVAWSWGAVGSQWGRGAGGLGERVEGRGVLLGASRTWGEVVSGEVGRVKLTYRREPRRGVVLTVLELALVAGSCGVWGCSGQGWGRAGLQRAGLGARWACWRWGLRGGVRGASWCRTAW